MLSPKEIFVIDAHGFLHRNYHALPKLTTSKGEEVGALYGFVNWLIRFLREKRPLYVAVCFDSKGPTFRHQMYNLYKANRPAPDEELVSQLKTAREVVAAMGLKVIAQQGAEADDIMATVASMAQKNGYATILVTADKDAYQTVNDNIQIWSGNAKDPLKGEKSCLDKFGVHCRYIPDYLSIVGDSSDNVPGIAGLGPKAAQELINNFGTVEQILAAADAKNPAIKPAILKKLEEGKENALLSKKLIVLHNALDLGLSFEDFKVLPPQPDILTPIVQRFEFRNLLAFMEEHAAPKAEEKVPSLPVQGDLFGSEQFVSAAPSTLGTFKDNSVPFDNILSSSSKEIFIYAEDDFFAAAVSPDKYSVIKTESITRDQEQKLFEIIDDNSVLKISHDIKFTLRTLGFEPHGKFVNCFDTALAKYCLDPSGEFSLPGAMAVNLGAMLSPAAAVNEKMAFYAKHIWQLKEALTGQLERKDQLKVFAEMEIPLMTVLLDMETNGIMVDGAWLKTLDILFSGELASEQQEINKLAGGEVNINSPKQLGELLFERLKLPPLRKTKTGYSTDEEVLTALIKVHPIAEHILKYRESAKLKSTYVDSLLALAGPNHRVHTNFNQTGTVTGRLSSFSPNLQNIPVRSEKGRLIRQAFCADEGKVLLSVDYSQIDLRVMAHESGDETLINAFKNAEDIHTRTAAEVFNVLPELVTKEMRSRAKAINFGIVYGQGPLALSQSLGISFREAKDYIDAYFARYDTLKEWRDKTEEKARREGFVRTLFGHVRYLPEFEASSARLASFANRAAINTIVQGGSSDVIKKAMIDIFANMPKDVKMLLQVHDELIFEVPKSDIKEVAAWVKEKMENAITLKVPLLAQAKAGKNWNEMGKVI